MVDGWGGFIIGVIISVGKIQKKCYYYYLSRPTNSAENGGAAAGRRNIAADAYIPNTYIHTHMHIYMQTYNRYIIPTLLIIIINNAL